MAKTNDSYVKMPTKTDQNDEKNVRALIGFGEVKATKTDNFLCVNPKNFSTRVTTGAISRGFQYQPLFSLLSGALFKVASNKCRNNFLYIKFND